MSDVTVHVNMTFLRVEERLPIKTSETEKAGLLKKNDVDFPSRQWKWHMLYDILRTIESTGFVKRLSGSDRRHSEGTDTDVKSINNVNCIRQDGQQGH